MGWDVTQSVKPIIHEQRGEITIIYLRDVTAEGVRLCKNAKAKFTDIIRMRVAM